MLRRGTWQKGEWEVYKICCFSLGFRCRDHNDNVRMRSGAGTRQHGRKENSSALIFEVLDFRVIQL